MASFQESLRSGKLADFIELCIPSVWLGSWGRSRRWTATAMLVLFWIKMCHTTGWGARLGTFPGQTSGAFRGFVGAYESSGYSPMLTILQFLRVQSCYMGDNQNTATRSICDSGPYRCRNRHHILFGNQCTLYELLDYIVNFSTSIGESTGLPVAPFPLRLPKFSHFRALLLKIFNYYQSTCAAAVPRRRVPWIAGLFRTPPPVRFPWKLLTEFSMSYIVVFLNSGIVVVNRMFLRPMSKSRE